MIARADSYQPLSLKPAACLAYCLALTRFVHWHTDPAACVSRGPRPGVFLSGILEQTAPLTYLQSIFKSGKRTPMRTSNLEIRKVVSLPGNNNGRYHLGYDESSLWVCNVKDFYFIGVMTYIRKNLFYPSLWVTVLMYLLEPHKHKQGIADWITAHHYVCQLHLTLIMWVLIFKILCKPSNVDSTSDTIWKK